MAVKKTYRINLRNYGSPPAVMVSQYDEGYAIAFEIFDGPLPVLASSLSGYTFKLKGRQPGNPPFLAYEFEGTLATALNAVVSFEIDTTMTGRAGKGTAELVILDEENDVKFASVNFAVYTEPAAVPDGSIDADVQRAMEIAEEVQEIVDTAAAEVKGEAEAWAVGQRDGEDVPSTDPTYENNAKYYAEQAQDIADSIGIDATLSISGKAADAKKTGDEISSLKEDLNIFRPSATSADVGKALIVKTVEDGTPTEFEYGETGGSFPVHIDEQEVTPTWERGTISTANGSDAQGDGKNARTNGYITCSKDKVTVVVDSSVNFSWRLYSATNAFLGTSDWLEGTQVLTVEIGQKLRFVCKNVDGTTLDVATVSTLVSIKEGEQQDVIGKIPKVKTVADGHVTEWDYDSLPEQIVIDNTLSISGEAADAKAVGDGFAFFTQYVSRNYLFTQGSISPTTGAEQSSTNRARSEFIDLSDVDYITIPTGINVSFRTYNASDAFVSGDDTWRDAGTYYPTKLFPTASKIRVVVRYTDDRTMTASNLDYIMANVVAYKRATMASEYYVDEKVGEIAPRYALDNDYTIGSIANADGSELSSTNRAKTDYIQITDDMDVSIPSGTNVSFRWYDTTKTFIGADSSWRLGGVTYIPKELEPNAVYFRMVVRYTDDRNLTAQDLLYFKTNVIVSVDDTAIGLRTVESLIENATPHTYAVADNNLSGNVTIKASKTINFDDGTKPYTEWYLLADSDGNYYRSKDLQSKEKLFTFAPTFSTHDKWAVGIDGNNNIFFVIASSEFTNSNTALDDSVRINPVYFLASEDYAEKHTLDFGTGLKPVGWLENVGWAVLPNNDIILCEYTRPHVKTCNVWHVDGADTTDPTNWTVTWSHNIITSEDPSVSGVKHCHYVAYDFYTDICYFGTGDSADGSYVYYSTDHGENWTLAWGPDRTLCRSLNLVFTADKVYWGSDSWEAQYHKFFIAERDENGIVDGANCTQIDLGQVHTQSCYGCVYLPSVGLIVMMDRNDGESSTQLTVQAYDLTTNQIVTLCTFDKVGDASNKHLGFRCRYVNWYPIDNCISVGFALSAKTNNTYEDNSIKAIGNSASNKVNNLLLYINRIGNAFDVRVSTVYV